MTGLFSFGNITGLFALMVLASGIFWAMARRNEPAVSVASMLRNPNKGR